MYRLSLARARNIVQFALYRHQRGGFDVSGFDALYLALGVLHIPGAVNQAEILEHDVDGFQVVVSIHVQHCVVLVIKLAVGVGAGVVAFDQVFEVVVMAFGVVVRVHGHKTGVLQEAGVNAAASSWKTGGHAVDHIVLKPAVALVHGQVVHRRGRLAGVNRAAHHGHAQGRCFTPAGHQ